MDLRSSSVLFSCLLDSGKMGKVSGEEREGEGRGRGIAKSHNRNIIALGIA